MFKLFMCYAAPFFGANPCFMVQPHALVYRGPAACHGCPEAVANLLKSSPSKFEVTYVGPNEKVQITKKALDSADVYAHPGGGGLSKTWPEMKPYKELIRNYVAGGGRYLGFCLGAYFAGTPGFQLLPNGTNTNEECTQPGAQVQNRSNTMIQVNWRFQTGDKAGQLAKKIWLFFQDGAVMLLGNHPEAIVVARYSSTNDIAASLNKFGNGWVGVVGPHPEADKSWYKPYHLHNPDGINFDYGHDLVEALMAQSTAKVTNQQ